MRTIILLCLALWQLVALNSYAETTTDNLLNNKDFDAELDSWTIEDPNYISLDTNCYNQSGLCQSVRWSSDLGKTISQTIDKLEDNYIIKNVYVSFTALGCNNTASGAWCTADGYDKVQVTINLSDGTNQENLYLEQELDYNDGTLDYALSTSTLDTWLTQDTNINFAMTGIDTGNWDGQFGPIVDNINLQLGIEEYVPVVAQPIVVEPVVVEPVVVEPIIEPVIEEPVVVQEVKVEEPKMVEGLDLKTEVTLDIINDVDIISDIQIEPTVELPDIKIEEPLEIQVETNNENQIEEIAEIKEIEVQENEGSILSNTTEGEVDEEKSVEKKVNEKKETTTTQSVAKDAIKVKPKTRISKPKVSKSVGSVNQKQEITLPPEYLQVITDTLIMTETIDLSQEMIYGGQQEYNLNTSSITIAGLDNNTSSRWRNLQDERKRFKAPVYRKKGQ